MNTINLEAVRDYLSRQMIGENFDIISANQAETLQTLFGVPYIEYPLPEGEGYIYAGHLTFQWTLEGPLVVQH